MSAVKWHEGPLVALDTETTGIDVHNDRIVTAAIVHKSPGQRPRTIQWLIDPQIEIPTEASDVHGWTNDKLKAKLDGHQALRVLNGQERFIPREGALFEIAAQAATAMGTDTPLIVHNAAYDLTLLETELTRTGIDTLSSRPAGIRGVVDPMVIEKAFDPYRKVKGGCRGGKVKCGGCGTEDKTLTSLCLHYGVVHSGAHDASADAVAALRLVPKLMAAWPDVARWRLPTLHEHQVTWRRTQADGLRAYFDKNGIEHDGVDPGWPVYSNLAAAQAGAA